MGSHKCSRVTSYIHCLFIKVIQCLESEFRNLLRLFYFHFLYKIVSDLSRSCVCVCVHIWCLITEFIYLIISVFWIVSFIHLAFIELFVPRTMKTLGSIPEHTLFLYQSSCQQGLFLFSSSFIEITYNIAVFSDTVVALLPELFLWL